MALALCEKALPLVHDVQRLPASSHFLVNHFFSFSFQLQEWDLKHLFQYLQTKGWAYRAAPSTDLATNWYVVSPEWAQAKNLRGAILGQDYFREMVRAFNKHICLWLDVAIIECCFVKVTMEARLQYQTTPQIRSNQ
jgi:hypothetical protein